MQQRIILFRQGGNATKELMPLIRNRQTHHLTFIHALTPRIQHTSLNYTTIIVKNQSEQRRARKIIEYVRLLQHKPNKFQQGLFGKLTEKFSTPAEKHILKKSKKALAF